MATIYRELARHGFVTHKHADLREDMVPLESERRRVKKEMDETRPHEKERYARLKFRFNSVGKQLSRLWKLYEAC